MPRSVRMTAAAARATASVSSIPADAARRVAWRDWSWFESTTVGQRSSPKIASRRSSRSRYSCADQGARDQLPVEDEVAVRCDRLADGLRPAVEQLADRHPARDLVDDRPEPGDQLREVGLVAVVQVLLAVPGARAGRSQLGVGRQVRVLEEDVEDVEPEAVDAAIEPAADHVELRRLDRRVAPVQLGLLDEERVHVELLARGLVLPGRAPEERQPVVGRQRVAVGVVTGRVAPQVAVGVRPLARRATAWNHACWSLVWFITRSRITRMPRACASRTSRSKSASRPEQRIDRGVVADVVADIEARADG